MKTILASIALLLAGCSTVTIHSSYIDEETKKPVECQASYTGLFMKLENVNMSACGGNGGATGASTQVSDVLIKAMLRGLQTP